MSGGPWKTISKLTQGSNSDAWRKENLEAYEQHGMKPSYLSRNVGSREGAWGRGAFGGGGGDGGVSCRQSSRIRCFGLPSFACPHSFYRILPVLFFNNCHYNTCKPPVRCGGRIIRAIVSGGYSPTHRPSGASLTSCTIESSSQKSRKPARQHRGPAGPPWALWREPAVRCLSPRQSRL